MKNQIEVELRGIMNEKEYQKTLSFFNKNAEFAGEKKRLSFVYFRGDKIIHDVKDVKDDPVDIRIRITNNKKSEIMLKLGKWGAEETRREISIPIEPEKFDDAIDFLKALGWKIGIIVASDTKVFNHKGVEFAIVNSSGHYYFEAERLAQNDKEAQREKEEIKKICLELGLKITNDEKFMNMLNSINNIKENQFDFSKQSLKEIREKYKGFF